MKVFSFFLIVFYLWADSWACNILQSGVLKADQDIIVNKHNEFRKMIAQGKVKGQPRGVNLLRMHYDNGTLASEAQRVANTCVFEHQAVTDKKFSAVGQNLYIFETSGNSTDPDWASAVEDWFDEHKIYTYPHGDISKTGHYTQVIWHNTTFVGCGYVAYKEGKWNKKYYVCNYGPAGNIDKNPPYKTGNSGCENLC